MSPPCCHCSAALKRRGFLVSLQECTHGPAISAHGTKKEAAALRFPVIFCANPWGPLCFWVASHSLAFFFFFLVFLFCFSATEQITKHSRFSLAVQQRKDNSRNAKNQLLEKKKCSSVDDGRDEEASQTSVELKSVLNGTNQSE